MTEPTLEEKIDRCAIRDVIIPIGPSIAYVPLEKDLFAIIDSEDAESVGLHNWHARRHSNGVPYAARTNREDGNISTLFLHTFITGWTGVDHAGRNTLDDRKCNLRPCNKAQNRYNAKRQKNNTSGYKGVCRKRNSERWIAQIKYQKKTIYLGSFSDPKDAHDAYVRAAKIYAMEFAYAG